MHGARISPHKLDPSADGHSHCTDGHRERMPRTKWSKAIRRGKAEGTRPIDRKRLLHRRSALRRATVVDESAPQLIARIDHPVCRCAAAQRARIAGLDCDRPIDRVNNSHSAFIDGNLVIVSVRTNAGVENEGRVKPSSLSHPRTIANCYAGLIQQPALALSKNSTSTPAPKFSLMICFA